MLGKGLGQIKLNKKMPCDKFDFVMKSKVVEIVKEVKRSDSLQRFACGNVFYGHVSIPNGHYIILVPDSHIAQCQY